MEQSPRTWHVERPAPVRADAEGLFVPRDDLPEAAIGDVVVVASENGGEARVGTIAAESNLDDERFFRLELHP